jgi:hypothetical protein
VVYAGSVNGIVNIKLDKRYLTMQCVIIDKVWWHLWKRIRARCGGSSTVYNHKEPPPFTWWCHFCQTICFVGDNSQWHVGDVEKMEVADVNRSTFAPATRMKRRRTGLTRDQCSAIVLLLVLVFGGSKLAHWILINVLDAWCIAWDLKCKPEGY